MRARASEGRGGERPDRPALRHREPERGRRARDNSLLEPVEPAERPDVDPEPPAERAEPDVEARRHVETTHDPREAVYLGDRVHVLASSPGRVRAVVEVDALYGGPFPTDREPDLRSTATFARLVTDTEALVASPPPPRG